MGLFHFPNLATIPNITHINTTKESFLVVEPTSTVMLFKPPSFRRVQESQEQVERYPSPYRALLPITCFRPTESLSIIPLACIDPMVETICFTQDLDVHTASVSTSNSHIRILQEAGKNPRMTSGSTLVSKVSTGLDLDYLAIDFCSSASQPDHSEHPSLELQLTAQISSLSPGDAHAHA